MRNYLLYINDIFEAIETIEQFVGSMTFEEFTHDDKTVSAIIRKFEVMGEASKNIPDEIREKYPDIPWKEMAGMRDKLIHFYFGIKHDLVWQTIKDILPALKLKIADILH